MTHRIRVAGLLQWDGKILLIKQRNNHGIQRWGIPGGRLEATDADIFRGAEREVWEETGLKVQAKHLRFISEHVAPDLFALTLIIECHLAENEDPGHIHLGNNMEDDNIHAVAWWPLDKIHSKEEPMSRTLSKPAFWEALEREEGVVYLGRHED